MKREPDLLGPAEGIWTADPWPAGWTPEGVIETLESGATIVSGMEAENIVEAVTLAISLPWSARYEFEEDYSPSAVVVNAIRTQITNFF